MNIREQKEYYDKKWRKVELPNRYSLLRGRKIIEYLESISLANPLILDLGCGTGWFTRLLSKYGQTTGIDFSREAIERARKDNLHITFISGDFFDVSLPIQHYDVVISMEVIEHVVDQRMYVKLVSRCLRSQGYLILSTPNRFIMRRMNLTSWELQPIENWLDIKSLRKLLMPEFKLIAYTTIIPCGSKGICRYINSRKISKLLNLVIPQSTLDKLKEWAGLGLNIVVLAQKKL
jgi:2-polyprenyl-3-methyl-5-hydroxy-6-metoxy-1,4-benzoquinol methylase